METQNGQVPHAHMMVKNWRNILAAQVLLEEQVTPVQNGATNARVSVPRKKVLRTSGCENQQGLQLRQGTAGVPVPGFPFKGYVHTLTC